MILSISQLQKNFGTTPILKNVSFKITKGETIAVVGVNGAGKSTTLKTISGMLRSKTGSITFMDEDISNVESFKLVDRGLAHVPEGRRIFLDMSVMENLEMGAYTNPAYTKEGIEDVFERFKNRCFLHFFTAHKRNSFSHIEETENSETCGENEHKVCKACVNTFHSEGRAYFWKKSYKNRNERRQPCTE